MALGPETVRATLTHGRPSLRITDPVSAALRGLARLGCGRIALLTPYLPEVNAMVERFLTGQGLELRATGFFPLSDDNARARVTEASFLDAARRLTVDPAVEALFISCTALRSAGLVARLEDSIGRPVVTSNQALCWDSLRLTGDRRVVAGAGTAVSGGVSRRGQLVPGQSGETVGPPTSGCHCERSEAISNKGSTGVGISSSLRFLNDSKPADRPPLLRSPHCSSARRPMMAERRDKRAMATEELPEWLVDQIATSEMDPRFAYLDEAE